MRVQTIAQLILACGLVFCGTPMTNAQVAGAQGGQAGGADGARLNRGQGHDLIGAESGPVFGG